MQLSFSLLDQTFIRIVPIICEQDFDSIVRTLSILRIICIRVDKEAVVTCDDF